MSQEAFIDHLLKLSKLDSDNINSVRTPYRNGYAIDTIPKTTPSANQSKVTHYMQTLIGCLNWLSTSMRPDIATATNLLAKYTSRPNSKHIVAVKRVIRYLKGTKSCGITFTHTSAAALNSYIKFPIADPNNTKLISMCDANWGSQDQSAPNPDRPVPPLDIFKSQSLSGFLLWINGPLHWMLKRQTITARSSTEAEIYATDECVKALIHLKMLLDGLGLANEFMLQPNTIYNDNNACVQWSRNSTTKGLRHVQIRENAIRESVQNGFVCIKHIAGKVNMSDLFTKEDKDDTHFISICDHLLSPDNI
jgi:hypothetical protein